MQNTLPQVLIVLWLNFVLQALPVRVMATYAELLIGAMISGTGHLTDALFAVGHQKHFSTYYWLIEKGKWSWLSVTKRLVQLVVLFFSRGEWNFIIDDFIVPRASEKAPFVTYHHDHSQKPNRPRFIWGQQWVALGLSMSWGGIWAALPMLLRIHKKVGNRSKITTALLLLETLAPSFREKGDEILRCLVDAWYMKGPFIMPLLKQGIHVIGQIRKDTALFKEPESSQDSRRKRGRPRKYGKKWTPERVKEQLPVQTVKLKVYGKTKQIRYRSTKCLARFLSGQPVIAVWSQLPSQKSWSLILSTDLTLTAEQIIKLFARRWKTEPMFNEIKHTYGMVNAWQQSSRALHRWVSILSVAYSLTRLLSLVIRSKNNDHFIPFIQWRARSVVTAGLVKRGLEFFFRQFTFSGLWEPKSKKLVLKNDRVLYQRTKNCLLF